MNKEQIISLIKYETNILNKIIKIEDNLNFLFGINTITLDEFHLDPCNYELLKLVLQDLKLSNNDDIFNEYYTLYNKKTITQKDLNKFYNYLKDYNEKKKRVRK